MLSAIGPLNLVFQTVRGRLLPPMHTSGQALHRHRSGLSLPGLPWVLFAALSTATMGGLSWLLFPRWMADSELSHAFFTPPMSLVLFWEAHRRRFETSGLEFPGKLAIGLASAALLVGTGALVVSGLYSIAFTTAHTMALFGATLSFVLFGFSALLLLGTKGQCIIPLSWPSCCALILWLLSAPLPPGVYSRLTVGMQSLVTERVLSILHLLGIPATRHGNVIELLSTSVGVEEACSGIRSLLSCFFAGLFFSAYLLRHRLHRFLIVGFAVLLALTLNLARSLALTLLAHGKVDISGAWHDWTGYSVLLIAAAILLGIALRFESTEAAGPKHPTGVPTALVQENENPARTLCFLAAYLIAVGVGCVTYLTMNVDRARSGGPTPALEAIIPLAASGWDVVTTDDLGKFAPTLLTDQLVQRNYFRQQGTQQVTVYAAYWKPGQSNPSQVALHTPDGCWPAAGWKKLPTTYESTSLLVSGRPLPEAQYRRFISAGGHVQHVWYWHMYRGLPIQQYDPYRIPDLLKLVLHFGFQPPSEQLFLRISSNREWTQIQDEKFLEDLFLRFRPFGL